MFILQTNFLWFWGGVCDQWCHGREANQCHYIFRHKGKVWEAVHHNCHSLYVVLTSFFFSFCLTRCTWWPVGHKECGDLFGRVQTQLWEWRLRHIQGSRGKGVWHSKSSKVCPRWLRFRDIRKIASCLLKNWLFFLVTLSKIVRMMCQSKLAGVANCSL